MKWLLLLVCAFIWFVPSNVYAALVPVACENPSTCGTCEFATLINNVIQFTIVISSLLGALVFMYAGFLLTTSGGNPGQIQKAKGLFLNVIIGLIILLAAFAIVNTVIAAMVGSESPLLSWQKIECMYPGEVAAPGDIKRYVDIGPTGTDGVIPSIGGGGSCSVTTSGNCAVSNLSCFGSYAEQASQICNIESSGGRANATSGTDLCKDGSSFSGGLFQINILANNRYLNNCDNSFFSTNGSGAQGTCLDTKTNGAGVSYCAVRDCQIDNRIMYNTCMSQTFDVKNNIKIACQLFNGSWGPWITSARRCNL